MVMLSLLWPPRAEAQRRQQGGFFYYNGLDVYLSADFQKREEEPVRLPCVTPHRLMGHWSSTREGFEHEGRLLLSGRGDGLCPPQ